MPETKWAFESFKGQNDLAGRGVFAAVCPLMLQKDLGSQFSGTISPWQLLKSSDMSAAPVSPNRPGAGAMANGPITGR